MIYYSACSSSSTSTAFFKKVGCHDSIAPRAKTINVFRACLGAQLTICAQKWRNFVLFSLRFVLSRVCVFLYSLDPDLEPRSCPVKLFPPPVHSPSNIGLWMFFTSDHVTKIGDFLFCIVGIMQRCSSPIFCTSFIFFAGYFRHNLPICPHLKLLQFCHISSGYCPRVTPV